jgi:WD40 repeat protein
MNPKIDSLFSAFESAEGVDLFTQALEDPVREVREVAHWLLAESVSEIAQKALRDYLPFSRMHCLHRLSGEYKVEPNYFMISASRKVLISNCYSGTGKYDAYTTINIWDLQTGELIDDLYSQHEHMGADRDGRVILSGFCHILQALGNWRSKLTYQMLYPCSADHEVWKSGQANSNICSLVVSHDGLIVACGESALPFQGCIVIWDIQAERIIHRIEWRPTKGCSNITSLMMSPDASILLSQDDFSIHRRDLNRLWNPQTGELIREFETSAQWVAHEIATTPDGICLASGIRDDVVKVWDIKTDEVIYAFSNASPTAMTPDGKVLAYCDNSNGIVFWDLDANQRICTLQGSSSIRAIRLSPDREWVVTYDADTIIRIYGLPAD